MARYVGIDIGTTQVKVAVVRGNPRKWVVESLVAIDRVASDVVFDDHVERAPSLVEVIGDAAREAASGGDPLSVGLEGDKTFVRTILVPAAVRRRVAEVLPFELEAQLPFDIEDAVFDYRAQSGIAASLPQPVLVVAARIEQVRETIASVQTALGREPDHVVPGAFPLADLAYAVFGPRIAGIRAILDLGSLSSEILVLVGGEPVFARTLSRGVAGMPATAPQLAREIRQTFSAYRAAGGDIPTELLLTGGGALVADMHRWLASELQMSVELLDVGASATLEGLDPSERLDAHRFTRAIGIALAAAPRPRGLDLRRGVLAFERGYGWLRERVPMLAGLGATVLVAFFFATWARARTLNADRVALEETLASVTKDVLGESTSNPERVEILLADKGPAAEDDPLPRADAMDVLVQLSELIPTDKMKHDIERLEMTRQTQGGFKVTIQGVAPSVADVGTIEANMKAFRCFQSPTVTKKSKAVQDDRQKYTLEIELRCPEEAGGAHGKPGVGASGSTAASGGH